MFYQSLLEFSSFCPPAMLSGPIKPKDCRLGNWQLIKDGEINIRQDWPYGSWQLLCGCTCFKGESGRRAICLIWPVSELRESESGCAIFLLWPVSELHAMKVGQEHYHWHWHNGNWQLWSTGFFQSFDFVRLIHTWSGNSAFHCTAVDLSAFDISHCIFNWFCIRANPVQSSIASEGNC